MAKGQVGREAKWSQYAICSDVNSRSCEYAHGKGFEVCETYISRINNTQTRLSGCEIPTVAGFAAWPVEEMSAMQHLSMIYAIEKARLSLERKGLPNFEQWQKEFLLDMRSNQTSPALYKAIIPTTEGKMLSLIVYSRYRQTCRTEKRVNVPDYANDWNGGGYVYFELVNMDTNHIREIDGGFSSPSQFKSQLVGFKGRPYFVRSSGISVPDSIMISAIRPVIPTLPNYPYFSRGVCSILNKGYFSRGIGQ